MIQRQNTVGLIALYYPYKDTTGEDNTVSFCFTLTHSESDQKEIYAHIYRKKNFSAFLGIHCLFLYVYYNMESILYNMALF
jgi:hypothetical protein